VAINDALPLKAARRDEIFRQYRGPLTLSISLPDCLHRVLFRRYSPLSLQVVVKQNRCKSFWPSFFWDDPDFSTAVC